MILVVFLQFNLTFIFFYSKLYEIIVRSALRLFRLKFKIVYHPCSQVIYGLAQCTRDLNASECSSCLTYFVEELLSSPSDEISDAVKGYSCNVAYKIWEDFDSSIPPAAIASAPMAPTLAQPPGICIYNILLLYYF